MKCDAGTAEICRAVSRGFRRESRAMESREERKNLPSRRTGEWIGMWRASFFGEFDGALGRGQAEIGKKLGCGSGKLSVASLKTITGGGNVGRPNWLVKSVAPPVR